MRWGSGDLGRDAALALRRLARTPLFVLTVIGTLSIGLGAFAVVYTAIDKILIEPLPYERPDDLYFVWRDYGPIFDLNRGWLSGPDIVALEAAGGAIEDVVGMHRAQMTVSGGAADDAEEIGVQRASAGFFELLGVAPALGRTFAPDELGPGRPPLVVLSDALWRRRFGADLSISGAEIRLDGRPFTVIGVMGPDFHFVQHASLGEQESSDAYITFDYDLAARSPGVGSFASLIRARPGTSPELVGTAVAAVGETIDRQVFQDRGLRLYPTGLKPDLVSRVRPALVLLGFAGMFLLLVILLNLATLLLARAAQREQEFAISRALGASRVALTRATILEAILLGGVGGLGGVIAAIWGVRALVALAPLDLPRAASVAVDWQIAAIVVLVGGLMGLIGSAAPAVWATRTELLSLLAHTSVRGGGGRGRLRRAMVVLQVALSLVLLSAAGLVVRSFERLLRADPGFEAADVLAFRVAAPPVRYPDATAIASLHGRTEAALAAIPGVTAVGASSAYPLSDETQQTLAGFPAAPGNSGNPDLDQPLVDWFVLRPGYLQAMRIPVLAGRAFDALPGPGAREAIIDRTFADRFFPAGDAIGATLSFDGDSLTVIGVVGHARQYDVHSDGRPQVYVPSEYRSVRSMSWAVRTDRSLADLIPDVRSAVRQIDPELALADVEPLERVVDESLRQQRITAVLVAGFSIGALLLAAMGIYGVVASSVTRRRREIAVRMALGAHHDRVLREVVRDGAFLVLLGMLLGVPGVLLSGRVIRGVLVGVSPFDPLTLVIVLISLGFVALAACYVPAHRVTRIEPARLLRLE